MKDIAVTTVPPAFRVARWFRHRPILVVALVVIVVAAAVLVTLHVLSGDPGSAKRNSGGSDNDRRANSQIVHRADRFVTALKNGDVATIQSLAYDGADRAQAAPLVAAFGNRPGTSGSVKVDEFGGRNALMTLSAPCQNGYSQQITIIFVWKRTSWISSGWYAFINPLDIAAVPATGWPRP